jgi:hypothetical protein
MDATNSLNKISNDFIGSVSRDYPEFTFQVGKQEHWSPKTKTIFFNPNKPCYGVLHELAHALLDHSNYHTDFELLRMESDAWELAMEIGGKYAIIIDYDHIQNCLDTYRDWLHRRSTCPSCGTHVLQGKSGNYLCYNCQTSWHVSSGRFVRPYRKITKEKTAQ